MTKTIEITCDQCDKPLMGTSFYSVSFKSQLTKLNDEELHFCTSDHLIGYLKQLHQPAIKPNKVDYLGLYD